MTSRCSIKQWERSGMNISRFFWSEKHAALELSLEFGSNSGNQAPVVIIILSALKLPLVGYNRVAFKLEFFDTGYTRELLYHAPEPCQNAASIRWRSSIQMMHQNQSYLSAQDSSNWNGDLLCL